MTGVQTCALPISDPNIGKDLNLGNTLVIGGQSKSRDGNPVTTIIDNISIYDQALSEGNIQTLYENLMGSIVAKDDF